MSDDLYFLKRAYALAEVAAGQGEVPVGAVVVGNGGVIGEGSNRKERALDVTSHAEICAIRAASAAVGDWRLTGMTLYTTLEPCPMCAGAILHARLDRVVYGAKDLRWGAAGTIVDLFGVPLFNHYCKVAYVPFSDSETLLKRFFLERRGLGG